VIGQFPVLGSAPNEGAPATTSRDTTGVLDDPSRTANRPDEPSAGAKSIAEL
jgi:hypothetical protein